METAQRKGDAPRMDKQNELELLRRKLSEALERLARLEKENQQLKAENHQLKAENERLKRILGNDSSNSSLPPSTDQKGKPANTYNDRRKSGKKAGAQSGHKGKHLSKDFVEQKIKDGSFVHRVERNTDSRR